jgi:hypothetical protein
MVPTSDEQIQFLVSLQRLLNEGLFVATYKYALLLALADFAVECGKDDGAALDVPTRAIAEKFIQYYWRQCLPYPSLRNQGSHPGVLRQNTGRQAGIITALELARVRFGGSLAIAQRGQGEWQQLVTAVEKVVKMRPLWKLQTVGNLPREFLYENLGRGNRIQLKPGVAYCLRRFHGLVGDLVRGAWVRYVRRFNPGLLGDATDLHEFLFGSERLGLQKVGLLLREVQAGKCFYCQGWLQGSRADVDHFVPWSRYPVDLGHNFVLAHRACNAKKSDRLPAIDHLEHWVHTVEGEGQHLTVESTVEAHPPSKESDPSSGSDDP